MTVQSADVIRLDAVEQNPDRLKIRIICGHQRHLRSVFVVIDGTVVQSDFPNYSLSHDFIKPILMIF
jgi:hypothetical protein